MDIATSFYAGLFGILLLALSFRAVKSRLKSGVLLGHGGAKEVEHAMRVQANFVEYVPMGLLLILFVEIAEYPIAIVHGLGAALVVARLMHAWGFAGSAGASFGRYWGTVLTWVVILAASSLAIWGGIGAFLPENLLPAAAE